MLEGPVQARIDPSGRQVVEVVIRGGYWPGVIVARAGLPLRIVFRREDDDSCTERVIFSVPRLDRRLAPTGTTTIDLPAQPAGEVRFTCGMGRYRGRIEVVDERRPSLLSRTRERAIHLEAPLGKAVVLWICSIPLIALLAIFALDVWAAVAVAAAALVASMAGCLWAFRGTTPAA